MDDAAIEVWNLIRETNKKWMSGSPEDVATLFHPDVVMASPQGQLLGEGRQTMVQSFKDYLRQVKTHAFEEQDVVARVFGDTAVVSYGFHVDYELDGNRHEEDGREVLVFARRGSGEAWRAVWRMQIPGTTP